MARAQETEPPGAPLKEGARTTQVDLAAVAPQSPTDVAAEPPTKMRVPMFGARGQWLITGESDLGLSWTSYDSSKASTFTAVFSPGIDYFLARNVSVGLDVDISYSDAKDYGADARDCGTSQVIEIPGFPRSV